MRLLPEDPKKVKQTVEV